MVHLTLDKILDKVKFVLWNVNTVSFNSIIHHHLRPILMMPVIIDANASDKPNELLSFKTRVSPCARDELRIPNMAEWPMTKIMEETRKCNTTDVSVVDT
jgi:hypothetical protein